MSEHATYLVVGGGMTADSAARGIRTQDEDGTIVILGQEQVPPFPRPPLSKDLWLDEETTVEDSWLGTADATGATLRLGVRVTSVDPERKVVGCDDGTTYTYDKLLLATGGHPRELDGVPPGDRVIYFRSVSDYERLRALASDQPRVVVVGGGYIGSEIAAALAQQECRVTLVTPDDVLGGSSYPAEVTGPLNEAFAEGGVTVRTGVHVTGVDQDTGAQAGSQRVRLDDGSALDADVVVLGLGIEPSSAFAAGVVDLASDGGIVVGPDLRTTAADVWAAGDVAEYPDAILGRRRVEHEDNATTMGETAGRIMAGSEETYDHTPMFYSDLFDHWYEAVGSLDASLTTVVDDRGEGSLVVYYLDEEALRGVLLWDCDGGVEEATKLLAAGGRPQDPQELRGSIAV